MLLPMHYSLYMASQNYVAKSVQSWTIVSVSNVFFVPLKEIKCKRVTRKTSRKQHDFSMMKMKTNRRIRYPAKTRVHVMCAGLGLSQPPKIQHLVRLNDDPFAKWLVISGKKFAAFFWLREKNVRCQNHIITLPFLPLSHSSIGHSCQKDGTNTSSR